MRAVNSSTSTYDAELYASVAGSVSRIQEQCAKILDRFAKKGLREHAFKLAFTERTRRTVGFSVPTDGQEFGVLDSIFIGDAVLVADCNSPGWAKGIVSGHLVSNVPRSENIIPSSIDVSRRPAYDVSRKSGRDGVAMLGEWHTGVLDSAPLIDFMRFGRIEGEEDNELMVLTGDDPDPHPELQPFNQLRGNSMPAPRLKSPKEIARLLTLLERAAINKGEDAGLLPYQRAAIDILTIGQQVSAYLGIDMQHVVVELDGPNLRHDHRSVENAVYQWKTFFSKTTPADIDLQWTFMGNGRGTYRAVQSLSKSLDLIQALNPATDIPPELVENILGIFRRQAPASRIVHPIPLRLSEMDLLRARGPYISWFNDWFTAAQSPYTACTIKTDLLLGWWQHEADCGLLTIGSKVTGSTPIIEVRDMPDAIRESYTEALETFLPNIAVSFTTTQGTSTNVYMQVVYDIWTWLVPPRQTAVEAFRDDMHEGLCVKLFFTMDEEVKRSRTLLAIAESGRFPLVVEREDENSANLIEESARTVLRGHAVDQALQLGERRGYVPEEVSLTRFKGLSVQSTVLTFVCITHRSFPLNWIYHRPISSDLALFDRFGRPTHLGSSLASLSSYLCCSTDDCTYIWLTLRPFACICSSLE